MSQQELEQGDLEVMGMVNGHSHPDATAAAEEIADADWFPAEEGKTDFSASGCKPSGRNDSEENGTCWDTYRKRKRIEELKAVLYVVACVCIAAALVAAWYVPKLLIWVVNFGVLACGITAAMKIEKHIRWWR